MLRFTRLLAPLSALAVVAAAAGVARAADEDTARPSSSKRRSNIYIVRMSEDPAVAYRGGIAGLRATRPAQGKKINSNDPDVVRYASYLDSRHDDALRGVGGARKVYDYRYVLNGFAAALTPEQAARMAGVAGVVSVEADQRLKVDTVSTPSFLGLTASGGLWEQLGGSANAGEGVIIGIVDTGIWPEHPSFSDRTRSNANGVEGKLDYQQIPGWNGKCVPGEAFAASHCNQKLIGCQFFVDGFGADTLHDAEFVSCRDSDSHGTHTASTAGGNFGVVAGPGLATSGMAPRARIASYKVCWTDTEGGGGCNQSDSAAAIDQAVVDGVDVINFSISGSTTNFLDAVEVAFLFAADAGVFVAASAGNSGPTASTVAHPSPWLTTVAASTHSRSSQGQVLANGSSYTGAILGSGTGATPLPLVYSGNVGVATDPTPDDTTASFANRIALCYPGHLDTAKVSGRIVLCDRGINARVDKSRAVQIAGGVGMVLRNVSPSSLSADLHFVPTVHVDDVAGAAIKSYIDSHGAAATARLTDGVITIATAPRMADFSSRGPLRATGDLLKPDLTAPGVDVIAGTSPWGNAGRSFDSFQGTSMSSPHVAGLAALLKHRHPSWTPMMIKSALMTTGSQTDNASGAIQTHVAGTLATPFSLGAGHVVPTRAADPGLVYNAGFNEWLAFLCGTGQLVASYCPSIAIDPSDLNLASIAIGDMAGGQTVKRTVTNVGAAGTYTVSVQAPAGIDVGVNPSSLFLAPGQSKTYEVTFTRSASDSLATGAYRFGSLTWSDGTHSVRSPLVIRPVALAAPASIAGGGASGSHTFGIKFGYTGAFGLSPHGLVAPATTAASVTDDPTNAFNTANPAGNQGITVHTLTVPAGTVLARISLFDDFTDGEDDLDLYVYRGSTFVGVSGGGTSAEQVNLATLPAAAATTYTIYVHGWQTDGADANYTLFTWTVGGAAGNLSAATVPAGASAVTAAAGVVKVDWTGLAAATRYLGVVRYLSGTSEIGRTSVDVTTP